MLAFQDSITGEFTLYNFDYFFRKWSEGWQKGTGMKIAFENSLLDILIGNFYKTPLSIFFSYVLFKKFYGHSYFRAVFYLPVVFGTVAVTMMQSYILDATGPIVKIGQFLGIEWPFEVLQTGFYGNYTTARATFFITPLFGVAGGQILMLTAALNRIPSDIFESVRMDGCGFFREFFQIAFPLIWSTIGITWIMGFVGGWLAYEKVLLLTGGMYNTHNLGYYLMNQTLSAVTSGGETASYNYPAAVGLCFTAVLCPTAIILRKYAYKWIEPVEY